MSGQRCKGTRDLSPEEMTRFRLIEEVFRDCCLKWGYGEVKTPTLEYLHLFTSTGTLTPSMLSKVYSFLDWDGWSGERVVLRPDGTIPVARLYIDSIKEKLAKLFYVTNIFIFEETGQKTRERWQCGAELIGAGSATADVELIMLAWEVLKELGFNGVELRLSHAGLIKALLASLGLSAEEQDKVLEQILDENGVAIARLQSERPDVRKVLTPWLGFKGESSGFLRNLKALYDSPELRAPLDNFIQIVELLEAMAGKYQIDIASGRGFEYYTGVIFQFFIGEEKVGGGGRYDALIPLMGGKNTPASGFALYLDSLMNLVKLESATKTQRILVKAEPEVVKEGFNIASRLRDAGYVAEVDLGVRETAAFRWTLEVQSKPPQFILTDRVKRKKFVAKTETKVLTILRGKDADKDSVA